MKNYRMTMFALASSLLFFASCSKEPLKNMTEDESRIYITNHDSTVAFGSYNTFSITDSVAVVNNGKLEDKSNTALDQQFIAAIKLEMQGRGYTLVNKDQNPDLGISLSEINNTYTGVVTYPSYWDGYGGYWDPYYWGYGGYPYYGSYAGVYSVTDVALSTDMFDLKNASSTGKIKSVWSGVIRGSGIFNPSNVNSQVNALFSQSQYIQSGN